MLPSVLQPSATDHVPVLADEVRSLCDDVFELDDVIVGKLVLSAHRPLPSHRLADALVRGEQAILELGRVKARCDGLLGRLVGDGRQPVVRTQTRDLPAERESEREVARDVQEDVLEYLVV